MKSKAITENDLVAILQEIGLPYTPLDYYPIGAYFETSDSTFNPNEAWGGTWVLETSGLVHVSGDESSTSSPNYPVSKANNNNGAAEQDGGAKTVTLQTSQIPAHKHGVRMYHDQTGSASQTIPANSSYLVFTTGVKWTGSQMTGRNLTTDFICDNVGGGGSHNNMQPYVNVYRWHRTA